MAQPAAGRGADGREVPQLDRDAWDLAPSTRDLYARLLEQWIDAEVPLPAAGGSRPRMVRLGAQSLASVTPAAAREWDAAVLAEAGRRAGER